MEQYLCNCLVVMEPKCTLGEACLFAVKALEKLGILGNSVFIEDITFWTDLILLNGELDLAGFV